MGRPNDEAHSADRGRSQLRITAARDGTLAVAGDLDASSAATLERALQPFEETGAAAADGDHPVIIDVRGVEFMDSSGLRTLVAASLRAGRRGTRVVLRNASPELARLLEITGLSDQFGVPPRSDRRPWGPSDPSSAE